MVSDLQSEVRTLRDKVKAAQDALDAAQALQTTSERELLLRTAESDSYQRTLGFKEREIAALEKALAAEERANTKLHERVEVADKQTARAEKRADRNGTLAKVGTVVGILFGVWLGSR